MESPGSCVELVGEVGPGPDKSDVLLAGFASGAVILYTELGTIFGDPSSLTSGIYNPPKADTSGTILIPNRKLDTPVTRMSLFLSPHTVSTLAEVLFCDYIARKGFVRLSVNQSSGVAPPLPLITKTEYSFDSISPGLISTLTPSFSAGGEKNFVLGGDTAGRVHLWDWALTSKLSGDGKDEKEGQGTIDMVYPTKSWAVYEDEGVSVIEIGELVIATGR
jgi:hypothetical protein